MQIIKPDNFNVREIIDSISASKGDACRPWYRSIQNALQLLRSDMDWKAALNRQAIERGLSNHQGLPIRFVAQSELPQDMAYEAFIGTTGKVPTRDNAHDFFNALVWLGFPNIKRELNALQIAQIARAGIGQQRGTVRDAATLFDENAALLMVRDSVQGRSLVEMLRLHDWQQLLAAQRETFTWNMEIWLFGHALMEKLLNPYKSITAHAWPVFASDNIFDLPHSAKLEWLDKATVQQLKQLGSDGLGPGCFTPLPVLGIPGWWPDQDADFYADTSVFRPKRSRS